MLYQCEGVAQIVIDSLTKRFGSTVAVDDLSFAVEPGTVVGFLGPNGAGKTTTLRALLGLVRPDSGTATIDGRSYAQLPDPLETVGAVLERSAFHPGRSGRNHLRVLATAAGLPGSRADELLTLVGLADARDKRVGGYSLGMRQRLALATALLGDPQVLVLDEPANGLDPLGIRWLRDFLRARAAEGRSVLVSSHVLAEVEQTVDHVVMVARGRLVAESSLEELRTRASAGAGAVKLRSPQAPRLAQLLGERGARVVQDGGDTMLLAGTTSEMVGDLAASHRIPVYELTTEGQGLEEIFLSLTADQAAP